MGHPPRAAQFLWRHLHIAQHASYPEFAQIAQAEERDYFVFATVRHPLDQVVSRYFKFKTDHGDAFSDPQSVSTLRVDYSDLGKYRFVRAGATFEQYFRQYHRRPFTGMIDLSADQIDYVIRYESLQAGFSAVLQALGLDQIRPVPVVNKTAGRQPEWQAYYTPGIAEQAKRNFGPFMQAWGYEFPAGWGDVSPSRAQLLRYSAVRGLAHWYLIHVRYRHGPVARLARRLRAVLIR